MSTTNGTFPNPPPLRFPPPKRAPPPRPRPPPPGYVDDLHWEGYFVIVSLAVAILAMGFDLIPPDIVCSGLMALYTAAQIITVAEAAKGFSNTGLLTVIVLYIVAEGVAKTGGLERLINKFLGRTKSTFWALARLQVPIMFVSAFLNNTPIVSLMIPILLSWCRRVGVSPKQMLIPLSHLTVFGGTITLIGTSTNLVVSGLQALRYPKDPRLATFNIFQITPYGIPYGVWGATYLILFARYLLPNSDTSRTTNLLVALRVLPFSSAANSTVINAGLAATEGLVLVAVGRGGTVIQAVDYKTFTIAVGDVLYFRGDYALVEAFSKKFGLVVVSSETEDARAGFSNWPSNVEADAATAGVVPQQHLFEVYVRPKAAIVGSSIRTVGFRTKFQASVIAVHRNGQQETGKLGDIILSGGDRLLIDAGEGFTLDSKDVKDNFYDVEPVVADIREFTVGFQVVKGDLLDNFVGKTVSTAGLRGIPGLFLTQISRASGEVIHAVAPTTQLQLGDILWFAGNVDGIQFLSKQSGLQYVTSDQIKKGKVDVLDRRLVQVVISARSSLQDKTLKEVEFRTKYDAVVVAIHRKNDRVEGDIGHVRLQAGDVLLLDTGSKFLKRFNQDKAFLLMSEVPDSAPQTGSRAWIAISLATAMVLTQIIGGARNVEYINLWPCAILTGILMLLFRCLSVEEARRSIMWDVYVTIASTFAIGVAMDKTAVATKIADVAANASHAIGGKTASLSAIYICTAFLSELLSNNSAAAIFYPIASRLGDKLGIDPVQISITVMLGASAGWILPWGYQCNLMVFIAGNYRAREFMRIGVPLVFWLWAGATVIFANIDTPWVMIVVAFAIMGVVLTVGFFWGLLPSWVHTSVQNTTDRLVKVLPGSNTQYPQSETKVKQSEVAVFKA